ncbi:MAG: hypothetical protein C4576_07685 [Desulfobacteraceae bacterium]|nr:MAG: hypothetical protein C4576_07685 [Desulfobacteraceae bacterium]
MNDMTGREEERVEEVSSRKLTDEDRYYLEQAYKEPVEAVGRIEGTAKFLIGAAATTSGLYLSAVKLALGKDAAVTQIQWFVPFLLWAAAITALILVLLPQKYATRERDAQSWKQAFSEARTRKLRRLSWGAALFVLGIFSGLLPFRV